MQWQQTTIRSKFYKFELHTLLLRYLPSRSPPGNMSLNNYLAFVFLLLVGSASVSTAAAVDLSQSPIIGVLTQEVYVDGLISQHFDNKTSYIAASYVKYLEGAGARVVPIWIGRNRSYYEELLSKINGVLLPGGATLFNKSLGYADAGEYLIDAAMKLNDKGIYMPIWGTCLGMELLVYKLAQGVEARINCNGKALALPLEFKPDYNQSRLFASASVDIITLQSKENVTYHWHQFCYTEKDFEILKLNQSWRVMALNHDAGGLEFISILEHLKYPFYGVQFHPEKPLYEFARNSIPHTSAAVLTGQFYANFFVNETRRNNQSYANATEMARALIYNYNPEYTSILGSSFTQQYLFTNAEMEIEEEGGEIGGGDDDDGPNYHPPYYNPFYNNPNYNTAMPLAISQGFLTFLLIVALSL